MLRGINRSIIEIKDTENSYFERVLIFVKPEFGHLSGATLEKEAEKMIGTITVKPFNSKNKTSARKRAKVKIRKRAIVCLGIFVLAVVATIMIIAK